MLQKEKLLLSSPPHPSSTPPRPALQILGNEIEILLNEVLQKEKLLGKATAENSAAHTERDNLRLELDKARPRFFLPNEMQLENITKLQG